MAGIRIQLELDDGSFTTRVLHAGESLDKFNDKVGQTAVAFSRVEPAHRSFIGHMRDVIVIVAAVRLAFDNLRMVTTGWAKDIIQVNAEFERLTYLLRGMSTAADPMKQAKEEVRQLRDLALEMPYSVKAITDTFVKLRASGTDPMKGSLKAVVDTVAAFGGTEAQLKRASLALQEMAGKGVVQTKELRRQLGQDIPRAIELMARALGVSIPQLSAIIEKGTLDAGTSMKAMYDEWERTFGGSAKRMMSTFNGMLAQTQTLIQNLALDVGQAGFFEQTKKQLKEFNSFLAGNQAKVLATGFGDAMASVVRGLREALDWTVHFRNEIMRAGEVLVIAFGSRVAISGLLALATAIRGVGTAVTVFRGEIQALQATWQFNSIGMAIGKLGMLGMGISTTAGIARYANIALIGLGTTVSFLSTYILPVVAIVIAAAYAFGLFEDKVNDAYESVKKYGAEDEKQLNLAKRRIDQTQLELALLERKQDLLGPQDETSTNEGSYVVRTAGDRDAEIIAKKKELQEQLRVMGIATLNLAKQQQDAAIRAADDALDAERLANQHAYDQAGKDRMLAYEKEFKLREENHQSTSDLEKKNREDQRDAAVAYAQKEYDLLEANIVKMRKLVADGLMKEDFGNAIIGNWVHIQDEKLQIIENARRIVEAQQNTKGISLPQALEKADEIIKKLSGDVDKYRANLAGANGEIAEFFYKMSDGGRTKKLNIFGDADLEAKIDEAKRLFKIMEDLKQQAEGRAKYDKDLEKEKEAAAEARFEAENRGMSAADKIQARKRAGLYGGLPPIALMQKAWADVQEAAKQAGISQDSVIGQTAQDKGRHMLDVVRDLGGAWNDFRIAVDKTPNDKLKGSVFGGGAAVPQSFGVPKGIALQTDYVADVIAHESGGNANAKPGNTSAQGLGQFLEKTWLEFLQKAHPERLTGNRDSDLALRHDKELMKQAIQWYANQNAPKLSDAGINPTNSNLYLAHLLGPGGAIAALTKSDDTLLQTIPTLKAALEKNPSRQNFTVGDLQRWSQSFIRNGAPGQVMPGDSRLQGSGDTPAERENINAAARDRKAAAIADNANKLNDALEALKADAIAAGQDLDGLGKHTRKLTEDIINNKYPQTGTNPKSPAYKAEYEAASKADAADAAMERRRKAHEKVVAIEEGIGLRLEEAAKAVKAGKERLEAESLLKPNRGLASKDETIDKQKVAVSADAATSDAKKADLLKQLSDLEVAESNKAAAAVIQNEQKKIEKLKEETGTASSARQIAHDDKIKLLNEELAKVQGNSELELAAIEKVNQEKALLDKRLSQSSPLGAEMKSWSDIGQNFATTSASWMNTFTDNLAKMTMRGQINWTQMVNSMITDIIRLTLRSAIGNMFGLSGLGGLFGGGSSGAGGGLGKLGGGLGKGGSTGIGSGKSGLAAQNHWGGMAGVDYSPRRMVDMRHFLRAPRFHEGGFPGLDPSEVPIIAKKGEEVGWPDQLAKKYGGVGKVTNNHVVNTTVNATGGRAEDNQDLAERVSRSVQNSLRTMVAGEIRTQIKPGGILNQ